MREKALNNDGRGFDKTSAFSLMLLLRLTCLPGLGPTTRDPINMVGLDDLRDLFL